MYRKEVHVSTIFFYLNAGANVKIRWQYCERFKFTSCVAAFLTYKAIPYHAQREEPQKFSSLGRLCFKTPWTNWQMELIRIAALHWRSPLMGKALKINIMVDIDVSF